MLHLPSQHFLNFANMFVWQVKVKTNDNKTAASNIQVLKRPLKSLFNFLENDWKREFQGKIFPITEIIDAVNQGNWSLSIQLRFERFVIVE